MTALPLSDQPDKAGRGWQETKLTTPDVHSTSTSETVTRGTLSAGGRFPAFYSSGKCIIRATQNF